MVTDANSKLKAVKDVIPSNWVEDVGVGKDWELCAGYWRFSDLVRPGEADFISSLEPNARMNFSDLSKYATPLELFCASASDLAVEVSSSSVDPGEDHEKVKSLNDVVFHQEREAANDDEKTAVSCGLRAIVSRGGPLDIGMFHTDPNRSRMSLEMWVCRSEKDRVPVEATLVSRRLVSPSSGGTGAPIWTLFVSPSGELCFLFNSLPERVLRTGEGSVNMGPSEDVPAALWSHIALTVDTSHSTTAHVSLFINGDLMAESMTMALPELPESELARTVMFVGPDLSSWRLTEFRIWACSRSAADIRNDKDVYLSLASKRRRLQHRIKGGKRLFLAMGSLQLGEPGVSSAKVGESQPVTNPTTPALMLSAPSKAPRIRASLSPPVKAPKLLSPTARGKPVIMKETPNEKVTQEIGLLSSHGLTSGDIVSPSLISRPHALPHAIVLCKGEEIVIVNIEPPSTLASVRYKLAAESAILCPRKDRDILALFSQRKLIVFDIKTRKKLAEQPIATQLLFWKFITFELILLVTPLSIYTWSIHPDSLAGTDSRPQKLCSLTSLSEE